MARLCVRITPNDHPTDSSLNPLRTGLGDVVCIVEDGHQFSAAELNCGQYRIIAVPGVLAGDLAHLVEEIFDEGGVLVQRRKFAVDHKVDPPLPKLSNEIQEAIDARDVAIKDPAFKVFDQAVYTDSVAKQMVKNVATDIAQLEFLINNPELVPEDFSVEEAAVSLQTSRLDLASWEVKKADAAGVLVVAQAEVDTASAVVADLSAAPILADYVSAALAAVQRATLTKTMLV